MTGLPENVTKESLLEFIKEKGLKCEDPSLFKKTSAKLKFDSEAEGKLPPIF
jgi:hypothetical protein